MCVNNLPRVARSSGTAGNRTRNLSITNPTPSPLHRQTPNAVVRSEVQEYPAIFSSPQRLQRLRLAQRPSLPESVTNPHLLSGSVSRFEQKRTHNDRDRTEEKRIINNR